VNTLEVPAHESSAEEAHLIRSLGPWQATALVVSTIIGTGVFLVAGPMARVAGSIDIVFIAWLAGTIIALCGMLCFAELGAALPDTGGLFAYLTRGLGPLWGFLFGWADSFLMGPAAFATVAAGFMEFAGFLFPGLNSPWLALHVGHHAFILTVSQPLAAALILSLVALNCLSVSVGGRIQVVLGSIKVAAIVVIILAGVLLAKPLSNPVAHVPVPPPNGVFAAILSAVVPVMWAYNGFQYLGNLGAEIRQPAKNIPRALFFGMLIIGSLYVMVNTVYFHVLTFDQVARTDAVASDVVKSLLGPSAATWLTIAMALSALATLHAVLMEEARVPYAMARMGLFFRWVGAVQPRSHSPIGALIFQGTLGAVIALTGSFEELFSLYIFVAWAFLALGAFTLIRLRQTEPELPRPYRAWGYPWTPLVFVATTLAFTANLWIEEPVRSSLGVLVILIGIPFYLYKSAQQPLAAPQ
jgi:amino acid transporter